MGFRAKGVQATVAISQSKIRFARARWLTSHIGITGDADALPAPVGISLDNGVMRNIGVTRDARGTTAVCNSGTIGLSMNFHIGDTIIWIVCSTAGTDSTGLFCANGVIGDHVAHRKRITRTTCRVPMREQPVERAVVAFGIVPLKRMVVVKDGEDNPAESRSKGRCSEDLCKQLGNMSRGVFKSTTTCRRGRWVKGGAQRGGRGMRGRRVHGHGGGLRVGVEEKWR